MGDQKCIPGPRKSFIEHPDAMFFCRGPDKGVFQQLIFEFGSTYGHLNGYRYQITAQKIRNVAVVQKGMKDIAQEKKAEERWACGGTSPK